MPGVTISGCAPKAARSGAASRPDAMTPSQPAAAACRARMSDELLDGEPDAHIGEIARRDARQHGDGEDLEPLALRERRRFHDRAIAVHGQERRPERLSWRTAAVTVAGMS